MAQANPYIIHPSNPNQKPPPSNLLSPLIISQKESEHRNLSRNLRNSPSEIAELHNFSLYGNQAGASAAGPTWPIS